MLTSDWTLKIVDFGLSTKKSVSTTRGGTPGYKPPELDLNQDYSAFSSDLFACAVILFVMCQGFPPFANACV